ncbi:MAG: hypothetical protein KBC07_02630 [Bacteroidales bacterium]|jgi:hypothetical protein|nr:hypothetical protein [Bacteroidales bacterium]
MKITPPFLTAIALAVLIAFPATLEAQKKMPKKYKNAPEQTIVIVTNSPVQAFDESEYPNLKFYYTPQEMPDFLARLHKVKPIPVKDGITGMVVDKEGVVVYIRGFNNALAAHNDNSDEYSWTILTVADKKGTIGGSKPMDDYLSDYVIKGKSGKKDDKKIYTQGEEPSFKGWDKGDIEGMELPDFNLVTKDGAGITMKEILNGAPAFIVFTTISSDGKDVSPMLWHVENVLYNYFPPRGR